MILIHVWQCILHLPFHFLPHTLLSHIYKIANEENACMEILLIQLWLFLISIQSSDDSTGNDLIQLWQCFLDKIL